MWLAAGASVVGLDPTQVIIAISGLLVAVVTAATGVVVAIINSRPKTPPAATSALDPDDWAYVRERVAVLERRANDSDNRSEVQDRRLDHLENIVGAENIDWPHRLR